MGAGGLRCSDDVLRLGVRLEARDVLGNGAFEQLHVLGQVADVAAERIRLPLVEGRPVEADLAAQGRPHADEGAGEVDLPRRWGR